METNNKILSLYYLRAYATIGVVCIHAAAGYFAPTFGTASWHGINLLDSLCRYSVPMFFMLSGVFHLQNDKYNFSSFLVKAIKLFFVYLFWQFVYVFVADKPFCIKSIIAPHYHLWFLPVIAVMYVLTPVFNKLLRWGTKMWICVPISILIGCYALYSNTVIKNISLLSIIGCAMYYILGYWLHHTHVLTNKAVAWALLAVSVISTVGGTCYLSLENNSPVELLYSYAMPTIVMGSIGLFALFLMHKPSAEGLFHKVLMLLSNISFGIYLIHPIFIALMFQSSCLESFPVIKCLATVLLSLLTSGVLSLLIAKIPYLKKIILK